MAKLTEYRNDNEVSESSFLNVERTVKTTKTLPLLVKNKKKKIVRMSKMDRGKRHKISTLLSVSIK